MRYYLLFLSLLLAVGPTAAQTAPDRLERQYQDCSGSAMCRERLLQQADALLERVVGQWRNRANREAAAERVRWHRAVDLAQTAWHRFRDADCAGFIGTSGAGGSGGLMMIEDCQFDRTITRARQIAEDYGL